MGKKLVVDIIMNERLWYGGEQLTRQQIMDDLLQKGFMRQHANDYLFYLSRQQPKGEPMETEHIFTCRSYLKDGTYLFEEKSGSLLTEEGLRAEFLAMANSAIRKMRTGNQIRVVVEVSAVETAEANEPL